MKILHICMRDLRCAFRQFVSVWIMIVPIILAVIINVTSPGAADTPLGIALLEGENPEQAAYINKLANVEFFENMQKLEARILARDDICGIIPDGAGGYAILAQGNEPEYIVSAVAIIKTYWETGIQGETGTAEFYSFGRTHPPLQIIFATSLILMVSILSGMLIAMNIVDEKADRTIRAMRVAPVSLTTFVAGKSLIGVFNSLVVGFLCVLAAGFLGVNYAQALLILLSVSFVSFVVGFMAGLASDDFMTALGTLKLLLVPFVGSILAVELLSENWQWLFYWSPFYWAYDGVKGVLTQTAQWSGVLLGTGATLGLTLFLYIIVYPGIRRKLV